MAPRAALALPPTYAFRPAVLRAERTYRLTPDALVWSEWGAEGSLLLADVERVRLYGSPGLANPFLGGQVAPGFERLVVRPRHGHAVAISSSHLVAFGVFEDRSLSFRRFAGALLAAVAQASPNARFVVGMPRALWLLWAAVLGLSVTAGAFAALVLVALPGGAPGGLATGGTALLFLAGSSVGSYRIAALLRRERSRPFNPVPPPERPPRD